MQPSLITDQSWIVAERKSGSYPEHSADGGKWLIFVPRDHIDATWEQIKIALEQGKLGGHAKVSTAQPNKNARDSRNHVICVYTYDANDETDVMHIREELRVLGVTLKIAYKEDRATRKREYSVNGHRRVSRYLV